MSHEKIKTLKLVGDQVEVVSSSSNDTAGYKKWTIDMSKYEDQESIDREILKWTNDDMVFSQRSENLYNIAKRSVMFDLTVLKTPFEEVDFLDLQYKKLLDLRNKNNLTKGYMFFIHKPINWQDCKEIDYTTIIGSAQSKWKSDFFVSPEVIHKHRLFRSFDHAKSYVYGNGNPEKFEYLNEFNYSRAINRIIRGAVQND